MRTQVWDGTGPIRMPRGEAHVSTNVSALSSNCRVFCILIVLLLSVWVYVGIRVPCPAVVSTAHIGPPAPTPVAGGRSSPRIGLHACEPRARIQPLGRCPEPTEVMNPLQCVCVCEPRGGIARADALACWLCPHICRRCRSIDSVPLERPYTHRTCCSAG